MRQTIYNIGVENTMRIIGGKWKPIILCHLKLGIMRTGQLRRAIPNITQKMLTQQLRELEDDGIVNRKVYNQIPPKVEYSLTDYGQSLNKILEELCLWGEKDIDRRKAQGENILLLNRQDVDNDALPYAD
ncbi:helix-turn-helix domain-containing protein [Companilactobacillus alimentarius]|uniref:MarR family transcriptional regulator n=1 Tax=Companilactobacillus alimentarius DSM 20249 TaxID=1423720 RepID=A0A2K9HIR7_9LACO|nr:helix-turn-helix domain-containing protein [Companilactobacillus alimentarius]AUI72444.1 MarR family transcriptional regulator [Companilactobacillus alimentarius DSM 20249]KRK77788.1 transcriptional regulator [Companilactobacillus alimentarius DSM 20249]MDT6953035.1 helix-turn-helix domain-containing protein [Companilactobacillus alimentarius]GEO44972.1 MarR family transcriptional regulator [Companilactobacillus alimentarius]